VAGHTRRLLVLGLALVIVAGLVVADIVTLTKAKPSYQNETRAFQHLLAPATTGVPPSTTVPAPGPTSGVTTAP